MSDNDAALNEAKAAALGEQEQPVEEAAEEMEGIDPVEEETITEDVEQVLPEDHKERSDLGRKVKAAFVKIDQLGDTIAKQNTLIEHFLAQQAPDANEFVTRADLQREAFEKKQVNEKYEKEFIHTFHDLANATDLTEEEKSSVEKILLSDYNTILTDNGTKDGATAFSRAYKHYVSAKTPLKMQKAPGVVTSQKNQVRGKALVKLSPAAEKFLTFIKKNDGAEKAQRLHKEIS